MLKLTIIVLIILIGSSLCSATETALLSVSPIKVQQLAQSQKNISISTLGN
jgi:Hemolysins and related proteins containing CBS domains